MLETSPSQNIMKIIAKCPSESMVPIKHRLAVSCSRAGWALSGSSAEEDEIWGWNQLAPVTSQLAAHRNKTWETSRKRFMCPQYLFSMTDYLRHHEVWLHCRTPVWSWWPPAPDSPYLNLPGEEFQGSSLINNISALLHSARLLTEQLSRTFPSQHLLLSSDYETELSIPLLACQKEPKNDWRWSEKIMNG